MATPMNDVRFSAHLKAGLTAALALGLCQVVVESLVIAGLFRSYVQSPEVFYGAQMYDFYFKLFLRLPGAATWIQGGILDHFLGQGIWPKLGVAWAMLVPNLVIGVIAGAAVAVARKLLGARAAVVPSILALVVVGFLVHIALWIEAIYVPKAWNLTVLVRHAGRVFIWEGTYISLLVLVVAGGIAWLAARLEGGARWATAGVVGALLLTNLFAYAGAASRLDPMADATAASAPLEPGPALADSLILISIDSLRADRVGSYGNPRETSPAIDRLAREGVRFSNAMSTTSWTTPAHMSMLTGLDVLSHGVITERDRLPDTIPTLAAVLQEAGLATAGIVSAPQVAGHYGFARGFDLYDDQTIPAPSAFDALKDEPAPVVESLATSWLRANGGKRFFLFLHFWDVHYDYMPPPPYDTMFDPEYRGSVTGVDFFQNKAINKNMDPRDLEHILALYDGELRWVDDHIARILAVLEEMGVEDRTAVIVTSDHGDEFFEHGFKGHGRTLYGEVTRVPLVVRVPGGNGTVVDAPASLTDLMPTALGILGVEAPARMNGVDLLGAGVGLRDRAAVYAWLCSLKQQTNCQAMQHGGEGTLIHRFQPTRVEFYGPEDVLQQRDQAPTGGWPRESQLTALERGLNARWQSFRRTGGERGSVELDQATLDRLRDLGYVD